MLCQECGKKEAVVRISLIDSQGRRKELILCENCCRKYGIEPPSFAVLEAISKLAHSLGGNMFQKESEQSYDQAKLDDRCPSCGTSLREIQTSPMRIGCGDCWRFFKRKLIPIVASCQKGATKHVGKRPGQVKSKAESTVSLEIKPMDLMEEKRKLEAELEKAVQAEEFEKAAELRDKIKDIELALAKSQIKATG